MRKVLLAAVTALSLVGAYGCASDCEVGCDKAIECEFLTDADKDTCVTDCDKTVETYPDCSDQLGTCADCQDGASCDDLTAGTACTSECDFAECAGAAA